MQIQFPNVPLLIAATRSSELAAWSLNQLLTAEVIGHGTDNSTALRIDGRVLTARSEPTLISGQRLTVLVSQLEPTIVLKVVTPPPELPTVAFVLARGLARTLPQQATPQQTIRLIDQLQTLTENGMPGAPLHTSMDTEQLAVPASHVLRALPAPAMLLDAQSLRNVIEQAGTPTEARLQGAIERGRTDITAVMTGDLRATLLTARTAFVQAHGPEFPVARLALSTIRADLSSSGAAGTAAAPVAVQSDVSDASTQSAPIDATVLELIDHVVARLQAHHLQNVATTTATTTQFVVELPLQHAEHSEILRFEYDGESTRRDEPDRPARAQVIISLLLDDGHEFTARIRLHDNVLGIRIGSDDVSFNHQLAVRQDELRRGLQAQGLEVGELVVGLFDVDKGPRLPAGPLIDARV